MVKVSLKYAAICGIFLTISYHVSYALGSHPLIDRTHLIFDVIVLGLFIFFAQKEFKSYKNGGILHFWQGMTIGLYVYGVASLFFSSIETLYMFFDSEFTVEYKRALLEITEDQRDFIVEKFGLDGLANMKAKIKDLSIWSIIFWSASPPSLFLKKMLAGFFITPVISIILRKQPK